MNPFSTDRYHAGETSWLPFHRGPLERLESRLRAIAGADGPARVIQLRSSRAGMGKTHLVHRLAETVRSNFEITPLDLRPETVRDWERTVGRGLAMVERRGCTRLFLLDHLDAFYGDAGAGMRIARLVERLSELCPGCAVLLSVNRDVWRDVFASRLPESLRDLLTWEVQTLPLATAEEAEGLVIHRMERAGFEDHLILQLLEKLDFGKQLAESGRKGLSPRAVFRRSRAAWDAFAAEHLAGREVLERTTVPFVAPRNAAGSPVAVASQALWPAADQARKQLHAVAEALRRQAGPSKEEFRPGASKLRLFEASAEAQADEDRILVAGTGVPQDPEKMTLPERFQLMRLRFLRERPLEYRPDLLFGLLQGVGQRFPSIEQSIQGLALPVEQRVLDWTLFGRRVWISVAPPGAGGAWESTKEAWKKAGEGERGKLAGFVLSGGEPGGFGTPGLDLIELSPDLLASLYAAEELTRQGPSGFSGGSDVALTAFLASELDFFWSRLTRRWHRTEPGGIPARKVAI